MQPSGWRRRARAPSRPRVPCAGPIPVPPVRGCVCDFFFSFSRFYPALGPFIRAPMPTGTQPRTCSHLPGSAGVGAHFSEILSTGGEYNFVPVGPVIAGPFFFFLCQGGGGRHPLSLLRVVRMKLRRPRGQNSRGHATTLTGWPDHVSAEPHNSLRNYVCPRSVRNGAHIYVCFW